MRHGQVFDMSVKFYTWIVWLLRRLYYGLDRTGSIACPIIRNIRLPPVPIFLFDMSIERSILLSTGWSHSLSSIRIQWHGWIGIPFMLNLKIYVCQIFFIIFISVMRNGCTVLKKKKKKFSAELDKNRDRFFWVRPLPWERDSRAGAVLPQVAQIPLRARERQMRYPAWR